ncbi:MAG: ABC transporter substrate-binding protein, partial [Bacillota bacterium]
PSTPAAQKPSEIRIGVIGPETGGAAQLGQAQKNAVTMAVEEINAKGGVDGMQIKVFFEDDEGSPTKSANAATRLIHETKVSVIIGAIHSSATLADMAVTQKAGIPQITAGSTGASITEQGNPYIFRTAVNDALQAEALVKHAKGRGLKKLALITASDDYGQSGAKLLRSAAEKEGLQVVTAENFANGDKDFKGQLLKIQEKGADSLFFWGLYTEAALIAKQARTLGINVPLFGGSGIATGKLMELGGAAVEGMVITQSFLPDDPDAMVQEFVKKYKGRFNVDPIPHGAQAYDTVYVIADAAKRAKSTDPAKLRDAIAATKLTTGVTGGTEFNKQGDDTGNRILLTVVKDGKFVLVK